MTGLPDLVPVWELAKEANLGRRVLFRRLRKLERALKRQILFKGENRGGVWSVDRGYLEKFSAKTGRSVFDRLRDAERKIVDLEADVADLRQVCSEHLGVVWDSTTVPEVDNDR